MGSETTIRCPKSLRERLSLICARESLKLGKKITQADQLEKMIRKEEEANEVKQG